MGGLAPNASKYPIVQLHVLVIGSSSRNCAKLQDVHSDGIVEQVLHVSVQG